MCRGEGVHRRAGGDRNGGGTDEYKIKESKVEMPCFFELFTNCLILKGKMPILLKTYFGGERKQYG